MLYYDELYRECERLKNENEILKVELSKFTDSCSEPVAVSPSVAEHTTVNQYSSSKAKIDLFKRLFVGRSDVFAKRWYSKMTEKSGYQPVCGNEWDDDLCDKRKYQCANCPNRKLMPLSDEAIYHHLAGKDIYARDVIGIYPLFPDDTCMLCCVDFDDYGFQEAVRAYYAVCEEHSIPSYIERSRSGIGAHIWIFFSSPIDAKTARAFVSAILTVPLCWFIPRAL